MKDKHTFIDSNVLLYLFTNDQAKKRIATSLLSSHYTISTQVVNENVNVCLRKLRLNKDQAYAHGRDLMSIFRVVNIYSSTITSAFDLSVKYELSYWDSLIVAAALESKCQVLLTEDMHHGLVINEKLRIVNPFIS
ncbi:PIN domain-containing protein [Nemorincola caseinilytica]|uniref:PIN domain-containing protein n=1 Tax=Nemorincola caseinilytica TaxID=2054315 RepID=UPI003CD07497